VAEHSAQGGEQNFSLGTSVQITVARDIDYYSAKSTFWNACQTMHLCRTVIAPLPQGCYISIAWIQPLSQLNK